MATVKCPHCGGSVTTGTSPWTIIGWIALVMLVLGLGMCALFVKGFSDATKAADSSTDSPAPSTAAASEPVHTLKVQEFECRRSDGGMAFVEGVVVNTGTLVMPYVELQVTFRDAQNAVVSRGTGYADTRPLAPGASSTFKALGRDVDYKSCHIEQANASGDAVELEF